MHRKNQVCKQCTHAPCLRSKCVCESEKVSPVQYLTPDRITKDAAAEQSVLWSAVHFNVAWMIKVTSSPRSLSCAGGLKWERRREL